MKTLQDGAAADDASSIPPTMLLPPRPNLGPEPLPESTLANFSPFYLVPAILVAVIVAWVVIRRRRAKTRPRGSREGVPPSQGEPLTLAPNEQLLALADRARIALIARFGEAWRAKTTEEIAEDSAFWRAFEPSTASALLDLLRQADLEKFARQPETDQGEIMTALASWETSLASLLDAAAMSTIKGK